MEKPELEKIIKRLEKLDIREWKYEYSSFYTRFVARTNGLIIQLYDDRYLLKIITDYGNKELSYTSANKTEKDMLKRFHEKIAKSYEDNTEKELQERLDSFLKE